MTTIRPLDHLDPIRFDTPKILKKLKDASRQLAELKGVAASIPNQGILINTLGLQEAKDSSAIENIVTTHDELFKGEDSAQEVVNAATKEVLRYRQALRRGFLLVQESGLLTLNHMLMVQEVLEQNRAGLRKLPGVSLKNPASGEIVYTPPQDAQEVQRLMGELERFINGDVPFDADPLIKMSLIHHQFESIHPFYDGNGRTGRIVNVLYLVKERLLEIPALYLSSHIVRTKSEYYRLLQAVRDEDAWEDWVLYMLETVEKTATETIQMTTAIKNAMQDYKHRIRAKHKFYSQDLINNLFTHPYTRIEFVERDLDVSRLTATRYLDALAADGFLVKQKIGRGVYYINAVLTGILTGRSGAPGQA